MTGLVGTLLRAIHAAIPLASGTARWEAGLLAFGGLVALVPTVGSMIMAVTRRFTGNSRTIAVKLWLGTVAIGSMLVLPMVAFVLASSTVTRAGLDLVGSSDGTITAVLHGGAAYYVLALVLVPIVGVLAAVLHGKVVARRGPAWPGRLVWLSYLGLVLCSLSVSAEVMMPVWVGFVSVLFLGALAVLLVGRPSWLVINRSPSKTAIPSNQAQPKVPERLVNPEMARPVTADQLASTPGPMPFGDQQSDRFAVRNPERFQKIRQLGTGGFGTVWLAKDLQLDRTVAVKFAHAPDADAEQRMLREARALAAVRHPNCVHVYDILEQDTGLGIVMEYLEGESLSAVVRRTGGLDDVTAAKLWATLADALSAAHAIGVLHRDIKPSNIIVDPKSEPHLIDFGIARAKGDVTLTKSGMMMGTPDFIAPETANGKGATPASDAWQLAATVSYALTGKPPRGSRDDAMAALLAAANSAPLTELPRTSIHRRLLIAALDPNPARRPTLTSISRQLNRWLTTRNTVG